MWKGRVGRKGRGGERGGRKGSEEGEGRRKRRGGERVGSYIRTYLLCCNVEVWSKGNGGFETPAIFFNKIEVNCTH